MMDTNDVIFVVSTAVALCCLAWLLIKMNRIFDAMEDMQKHVDPMTQYYQKQIELHDKKESDKRVYEDFRRRAFGLEGSGNQIKNENKMEDSKESSSGRNRDNKSRTQKGIRKTK